MSSIYGYNPPSYSEDLAIMKGFTRFMHYVIARFYYISHNQPTTALPDQLATATLSATERGINGFQMLRLARAFLKVRTAARHKVL